MQFIHRDDFEEKIDERNATKQQFPPEALNCICKEMKIGQYYQPLPLSSSADAIIRIDEKTLCHFQFKNYIEPFDCTNLSFLHKEVRKCFVEDFKNYCIFICSSGNSTGTDAFFTHKSVDIILLSKSSVELFLGKHALIHLESKNLTDDSDGKLMNMSPLKSAIDKV